MNVRKVADSIVTRIIVLGIGLILAGALTRYLILSKILLGDFTNVIESQQEAIATYVAKDIGYKLGIRQTTLGQMARTLPPALVHRPEELRVWLGERHDLSPLFTAGLIVTDRAGRPLADYPPQPGRHGIVAPAPNYLQGILAGTTPAGQLFIAHEAREATLQMAFPILDGGGKVVATLTGITALTAPGFLDQLQHGHIGQSGGFLLISPADQLFLAASDPAMALTPTPPAGINALHDRAMAGFRGTGITLNARGQEELSAMVSVPGSDWFVVARIPTAEAFSTIHRAKRYVLGNSGLIVAIFVLFSLLGLHRVFRPLRLAADHAEKMTQGDLPLAPLPVVRRDEVGHLTAAFNRLLDKLLQTQAELDHMAHHDPLTGLPNRMLLYDRLSQARARAERNGTQLAVLFMDLDGFKPINDILGHDAGDAALIEVARRLSGIVRAADTLARVGGDEFVILVDDLRDTAPTAAESAVITVATKCLRAFDAPIVLDGQAQSIGLSIGIALGDGQSATDDLLSAADGAMYQAKHNGRGCYSVADRLPPR